MDDAKRYKITNHLCCIFGTHTRPAIVKDIMLHIHEDKWFFAVFNHDCDFIIMLDKQDAEHIFWHTEGRMGEWWERPVILWSTIRHITPEDEEADKRADQDPGMYFQGYTSL